jgi:hypothetical protein
MADDYVARIKRTLADHGIDTFRIETHRKHRRLVVNHAGRRITITFSATPSDSWRGPRHCEADLRRALRKAEECRHD